MKVVKVFVRHLPVTLNPGKLAAQVHHAGVQLMVKFSTHADVKDYLASALLENADGFGTTIVLEAVNKVDTEAQIRNLVDAAVGQGLPAGIVVDPSYPIADGFCQTALTCGYVLAEHDHPLFSITGAGWTLHK